MVLADLYERNALSFRDHPAIVFEGRTISFGRFHERLKRLGNALFAGGAKPQDRVAILAMNCPEYLEVQGVAGLAGFIAVGINYRLAAVEQAEILRDCAPAVFIFESGYTERAAELCAALPKGARLVCIGAAPAWAQSYEALISRASDAALPYRARESDTVLLVYTSGTTGRAKGVMLSSEAQIELARNLAAVHTARQTDRMLIVMPFYHIGGTIESLTYWTAAATIILFRSFDACAILEAMQEYKVTAAHLAPTMIQMMLEVYEPARHDISSVETICYASAPMSVALSRRANAVFGKIFIQVYGMSEGGPTTALLKHQHHLEGTATETGRLASAGQPVLGCEVRVVRDDGSDCEVGEVGEVWGRSKGMMHGYWRNAEATRAAIGDGWMHSGDMGYFDGEHYLFIVDRKKDMIISGGENIYSREVEEALLLHPAVAEAAVIGVPDPKWGESVKACVAFKSGMKASAEELVEHCRSMIASYKKPKTVDVFDALPRISSTNKIDKKALREPYWAAQDRRVS
jgi:acyl-CoA synthetase (AMP-forming)/AMP-acid ligase II